MGETFITKGTTIILSVSGTDIKAVLVEDPELSVGEAENNKLTASDGTSYSFAGQEGDNEATLKVVIAHDTITDIMNSIYGSGTISGTTETIWDLIAAGGTTNDITFTPPTTAGNRALFVKAVNAKGLVAKPIMELGMGWQLELKYTCDKYQLSYDSDTTD